MTVIDQASSLRSMMMQQSRATVCAITSGKGGVGKSNIAVNLAVQLAGAGKEVILLDADLGLANADVLCNLDLQYNLAHVISRQKDLCDVMVDAPGGFRLVGGASGLARMADLSDFDRCRIVDAMADLEREADVILIDTGAGISPNVLSFTRAADHVLVVTTPEPTAITDAYAMIKAFALDSDDGIYSREPGNSIGLLVNQAESRREARQTYERIAGVSARFLHLPVSDYGYVLRDDHVISAVRERFPVVLRHPRCSATMCLMSTAARLSREIGVKENAQARQGLFYRVMNMFV